MDSCIAAADDDVSETKNHSNFHKILIDQSTEMDLNILHQQPSNINTSQQALSSSSSINDGVLHWCPDIHHINW